MPYSVGPGRPERLLIGNFYSSLIVRGVGRDEVIEVLHDRHAFVVGIGDEVVVFDEDCESQDARVMTALGSQLSNAIRRPVLGVINHDDDVLAVQLYRDGTCIVDYDSSPGFFDGDERPPSPVDAEALCEAFGVGGSAVRVAAILASNDDDYLFAIDRHRSLNEALGLPMQAVGYGFSYISNGALPDGIDRTDMVEVGRTA